MFDDTGLTLHVWSAGALALAWSDVEFVCLTPAQEKGPEGWRAKGLSSSPVHSATQFLEARGLLTVGVVVKDRRPPLGRITGWWARRLFSARLRPMWDADDRPHVDQSLLNLDLQVGRLDASKDALLDLLAARCRFDLVVYDFG